MQRKEITLVLLAHCCSALWYIVLLSLKVSLTSKAHIVLDHNRGGQVYREELKLSVEKLSIMYSVNIYDGVLTKYEELMTR